MASARSLGHSSRDFSLQGATVATSMGIYIIAVRRRPLSVDNAHFLATLLQPVPRTFSSVRHVVERDLTKRLTLGVRCTAGNSQGYSRQPTNHHPLSQPFLFSTNSLPIPVLAHSW
jgi:hypothetical protein